MAARHHYMSLPKTGTCQLSRCCYWLGMMSIKLMQSRRNASANFERTFKECFSSPLVKAAEKNHVVGASSSTRAMGNVRTWDEAELRDSTALTRSGPRRRPGFVLWRSSGFRRGRGLSLHVASKDYLARGYTFACCIKAYLTEPLPLHVASKFGHDTVVKNAPGFVPRPHEAPHGFRHHMDYLAPYSTPLHVASKFGHDTVVKNLIEAGGEIGRHDDAGYTPLDWAAYFGHEGLIPMLLPEPSISRISLVIPLWK